MITVVMVVIVIMESIIVSLNIFWRALSSPKYEEEKHNAEH